MKDHGHEFGVERTGLLAVPAEGVKLDRAGEASRFSPKSRGKLSTHASNRRRNPKSAIHEDALGYARLGLRVTPLKERSKAPRQRQWPEKATCDQETIRGWPRAWGDGNLGIATGDGLFVLDVDPRKGGNDSLGTLLAKQGSSPATAEALTGSGGRHLLFRVPRRCRIGCRTGWRPGLDILGEDGLVVVEPSIHPDTGRKYVWLRHPRLGIAEAPKWLAKMLPRRRDGKSSDCSPSEPNSPASRASADVDPALRPGRWRHGDRQRLLAEMVEKFPVPAVGTRNDQMTRAVGSLVGREFDDAIVVDVMMAWWEYFARLGRTRTGRKEMDRELRACIRSTRGSKSFRIARGGGWHRRRSRAIRLTNRQTSLLHAQVASTDDGIPSLETRRFGLRAGVAPPGKSVTLIGRHLCETEDEEQFVGALIVHVPHKRLDLGESVIRMTDDQIRQIAKDRRGRAWRPWDNKQMDRLKRKYIGRPGQAATRFELLRMIERGSPPRGPRAGRPSIYETTGIEQVLTPKARRMEDLVTAA